MTEEEYIVTTNMARIEAALFILQNVMPGFDGVVSGPELREIRFELFEWVEKLRGKIETTGEAHAKEKDNSQTG